MSGDFEFAMIDTGLAYLIRTFRTAVDKQYSAALTSSADTDGRARPPSCAENNSADTEAPSHVDLNLDRPQDTHDEGETQAFGQEKTQYGKYLRSKECLHVVR